MQTDALTPEQALSLLRSQIQDRLEDLQEDSKQAIDQGRFDQAQTLLQQAQALTDLLKDLDAWAKRFATLVTPIQDSDDETPRLRKGLKTPQSAYRVPILRALVTLGGEAAMDAVLEQVESLMADQLNDYDRSTLSDGKTIRWVNTAQWARNALREEGLIRDDTPRGVWGISGKGEAWLKAQTKTR
jgi:restriction system protein